MKLTVVIPTLNEAKALPQAINSLKFADEILIIDSGSTDGTILQAKKLGARVMHHPFKSFAATRNFGDDHAQNDWILSLDADVTVPASLAQEIATLPDIPSVYKIGRINLILDKPMLHADWGPRDDNHIRLYHRSQGSWQGDVHEQFIATSSAQQLRHHLLHHNYHSVSEFITKLNFYSELEARRRRQHGHAFSYFHLLLDPLYDFGKRYFYKLGFLDGLHGFFLCFLQSLYHLAVNIKLYPADAKAIV